MINSEVAARTYPPAHATAPLTAGWWSVPRTRCQSGQAGAARCNDWSASAVQIVGPVGGLVDEYAFAADAAAYCFRPSCPAAAHLMCLDLGSCPLRARSHGEPPALAGRRSLIVHRNISLLKSRDGPLLCARRYSGLVWWCDPVRGQGWIQGWPARTRQSHSSPLAVMPTRDSSFY